MNEWIVAWYSPVGVTPEVISPRPCSQEGRAWQMFVTKSDALAAIKRWNEEYPGNTFYLAQLDESLGLIDDSWLGYQHEYIHGDTP